MTQQNAALVEEAAAAAESLLEQADQLMNAVNVFHLEGENQSSRGSERRASHSPMRNTFSKSAAKPAPAKLAVVKNGTDDGSWTEF